MYNVKAEAKTMYVLQTMTNTCDAKHCDNTVGGGDGDVCTETGFHHYYEWLNQI